MTNGPKYVVGGDQGRPQVDAVAMIRAHRHVIRHTKPSLVRGCRKDNLVGEPAGEAKLLRATAYTLCQIPAR